VMLGAWTNWSRGSILGSTLTLTKLNGGLLTALLALFVTLAGSSFWRIACFVLHFILSSHEAQDGLYHQRQAILRNAANGTTGIFHLLQVNWAWRKKSNRASLRILPLALLSIAISIGFGLAGIFSSRVSTAMGNEVLLTGKNCGRYTAAEENSIEELLNIMLPYTVELLMESSSYATTCYNDNATTQACPTYVDIHLPTTVETNVTCPFGGDICITNSANLRLDTGYINSHSDLGINAPPEDRFAYRQLTTCAPIKTEGYTVLQNSSDNAFGGPYIEYHYGAATATNYTHVYPYRVMAAYADGTGSAAFDAIAELRVVDADLSLYFLSANNVEFVEEVDDVWFAAHQPGGTLDISVVGAETNIYYRDSPASVLACIQQYQYCNPNLPTDTGCTPLSGVNFTESTTLGMLPDRGSSTDLWTTANQKAALEYFIGKGISTTLADIVGSLGNSALTARDAMWSGLQGPLGSDQWQIEVQHWHATSLAILQRILVEQATGPEDTDVMAMMARPTTDAEWKRCKSQKVQTTGYTSFSILGLVLIFTLGSLIILVAHAIDPLSFSLPKSRSTTYQRIEWIANDTLQLQRLAHEGYGFGSWSQPGSGGVPVTEKSEALGVLDITNTTHPRLEAPP
ncbi:hypothetical protein K490DRAFT_10084, partial [Saccharata proteae CBS 121410]